MYNNFSNKLSICLEYCEDYINLCVRCVAVVSTVQWDKNRLKTTEMWRLNIHEWITPCDVSLRGGDLLSRRSFYGIPRGISNVICTCCKQLALNRGPWQFLLRLRWHGHQLGRALANWIEGIADSTDYTIIVAVTPWVMDSFCVVTNEACPSSPLLSRVTLSD